MGRSRFAAAVVVVVTAFLLQVTVLARLPIPGGRPELVLLVVVAFALAEGPFVGLLVGFGAGLLLDAVGTQTFGLQALVYCLTGYGTGSLREEAEGSPLAPLLVVAVAVGGATLLYAGLGALLSDPRVSWSAVGSALPAAVGYDVLMAPFVLPAVSALGRRRDHTPVGR